MIRDSPLPVSSTCAALSVKRSSYYAWKSRKQAGDSERDVSDSIHAIALEFPGYGYRRITAALHRQGKTINHKRVLRLMREEHIVCKRKSFKPQTTNSNHDEPLYPNLTSNLTVTGLNQLWVADITYILLAAGWAYLAAIIDRFSRKCVGWALSKRIDTRLCEDALEMAITKRQALGIKGLIHHSDRGVQYASHAYVNRLDSAGISVSMTQTGNPRENAFAESFFKTLKVEEVYLREYHDFEEAYRNIEQFIEEVYNTKRLHSSIGYQPPDELEAEVLKIRLLTV